MRINRPWVESSHTVYSAFQHSLPRRQLTFRANLTCLQMCDDETEVSGLGSCGICQRRYALRYEVPTTKGQCGV